MRWLFLVTFVQTTIDAMNALLTVPADCGSFGHDYRADMARFVRDTYHLRDTTDTELARSEQVLRSLELERAERIKGGGAPGSPPVLARRSGADYMGAGVPLRSRRTRGARWIRRRGSTARVNTAMPDLLAGRGPEPAGSFLGSPGVERYLAAVEENGRHEGGSLDHR
jgi:hypothetical protein